MSSTQLLNTQGAWRACPRRLLHEPGPAGLRTLVHKRVHGVRVAARRKKAAMRAYVIHAWGRRRPAAGWGSEEAAPES